MMTSDPRVFFASERTLLAWIRTGIAIVGLGFLVSRFGLFLHLLSVQNAATPSPAASGYAHVIGVLLVILGSCGMAAATVQHVRFIATLPEIDKPASYALLWTVWLAGLTALACMALAGYLALAA